MATTLRDLFAEIRDLTEPSASEQALAHTAVTALGHAGRALTRLAADNAHPASSAWPDRRELLVRELGIACRAASSEWSPAAGRLPDLVGVAADILGSRRRELDPAERWSAAVEMSETARRCVNLARRFEAYASVPALARAHRVSSAVEHAAMLDPPDRLCRTALDASVPVTSPSRDLSAPGLAAESAAALVSALRSEVQAGTLRLDTVLVAALAGQVAAQRAAAVATALEDGPMHRRPGRSAGAGWCVVQAALRVFDDGHRRFSTQPSTVAHWALQLHHGLERATTGSLSGHREPAEFGELATSLRVVANHLPVIATHLEAAVRQWGTDRTLCVRARNLDRSEEHIRAVIDDSVVMANVCDLTPVLGAIRVTGRLSAALAAELDSSAHRVGRQPQPHLAAALAALSPATQLERDASWATRLATRCAASASPVPQPRVSLYRHGEAAPVRRT